MSRMTSCVVIVCMGALCLAAPAVDMATFRAACATRAKATEDSGKIALLGQGDWMFLARELRHLGVGPFWGEDAVKVGRATKPEWADPLPAIVDFRNKLAEQGVSLIFVPVPAKASVYPDKLIGDMAADTRVDTAHAEFYELLGKAGVDVLDLTPVFRGERQKGKPDTYCRHDTHWSGHGCAVTARLIADKVRDLPWTKSVVKRELTCDEREVEITGDLWQDIGDAGIAKERLPLRFVGEKVAAELKPVEPDESSPVLVLGDSHGLVFHAGNELHATGAGFVDQLAYELGFAVDLIAVRGSGASSSRISLYRRSARDSSYLAEKKLVIWCISAREFTEASGWRELPVVKP